MKPITPKQYAACYGLFFANIKVASKVVPALSTWADQNFGDIRMMAKLNSGIFLTKASIDSFPSISGPGKNYSNIHVIEYNRKINYAWNTIRASLSYAMSSAEMDPSNANKILASFDKLKPKEAQLIK